MYIHIYIEDTSLFLNIYTNKRTPTSTHLIISSRRINSYWEFRDPSHSLNIQSYHLSFQADLQGFILYPHRVDVGNFLPKLARVLENVI